MVSKRKVVKEYGLFATMPMQPGDAICEYIGNRTIGKPARDYYNSGTLTHAFFYYYNQVYNCLDAVDTDTYPCGLLNHSRLSPNCKIQKLNIEDIKDNTIVHRHYIIVAIRNIAQNEELKWDYGEMDASYIARCPWIATT